MLFIESKEKEKFSDARTLYNDYLEELNMLT